MAKTRSVFSFRYGVFDLDGTLIDSMGECGGIFAGLLAPSGVPFEKARRYYYRTTGSPMRDQFRGILNEHGVDADGRIVERLHADFNARFLACDFPVFAGARNLLKGLVAGGAALFLSSASSDACVAKRLKNGDMRRFFRLAFGSTAMTKGPAHLARFARASGETTDQEFASRSFFCGDGEADMRIAKAAGMYAIGVRGTASAARLRKAGADRIIPSIRELLTDDILGEQP